MRMPLRMIVAMPVNRAVGMNVLVLVRSSLRALSGSRCLWICCIAPALIAHGAAPSVFSGGFGRFFESLGNGGNPIRKPWSKIVQHLAGAIRRHGLPRSIETPS